MNSNSQKVYAAGKAPNESSTELRNFLLSLLAESPGLLRSEIVTKVQAAMDVEARRVYNVLQSMIQIGHICAEKKSGQLSKYFAADAVETQRVKIVPAKQWDKHPGKTYSPIDWVVHQLQGVV